jgi:hypothetical protein
MPRFVHYALLLVNGAWLSLVERYVRDVEVAGSNPVAPTIFYAVSSRDIAFFVPKSGPLLFTRRDLVF